MIIYVDIDGTICHTENSDYENSTPRYKQIEKINKLYDEGHEIVYWTARGGTTGINWSKLSQKQLVQLILILVLIFLIVVTLIYHPLDLKKPIPFLSNLTTFGLFLFVYSDSFSR